jgi:hypothetical protein
VKDLTLRERFVFAVIVAAALIMGVWPKPILDRSEATVQAFVASYRDRLNDSARTPGQPPHFFPAPPAPAAPAAAPAPAPANNQ